MKAYRFQSPSHSPRGPHSGPSPQMCLARDGVASAMSTDDGSLYVCGGAPIFGEDLCDTLLCTSFERVLRLDTLSAQWEWLDCHGDVPLPRHHHTAVYYRGSLIVCGGELLSDAEDHPNPYRDQPLIEHGPSPREEMGWRGSIRKPPQAYSPHTNTTTTTDSSGANTNINNKSRDATVITLGGGPFSSPFPPSSSSVVVPFSASRASLMAVYVLNLTTREWTRYKGEGEVPLDRCSHTSTVVGNTMITLGGRPLLQYNASLHRHEYLSNEGMLSLRQQGFFEANVLHLGPMVWQRLHCSRNDPMKAPQLWGHTAVCSRDRTLLVFGGMDVGGAGEVAKVHGAALREVPEACPSASTYVLDTRTMLWERLPTGYDGEADLSASPRRQGSASYGAARGTSTNARSGLIVSDIPPPAYDQCAVLIPNAEEVLLVGGWGLAPVAGDRAVPANGRSVSTSPPYRYHQQPPAAGAMTTTTTTLREMSDLFVFNIPSRQWRRIACPHASTFGGNVIACTHGSHILVTGKAHSVVYGLDCHVNPRVQGWQVYDSTLARAMVDERAMLHDSLMREGTRSHHSAAAAARAGSPLGAAIAAGSTVAAPMLLPPQHTYAPPVGAMADDADPPHNHRPVDQSLLRDGNGADRSVNTPWRLATHSHSAEGAGRSGSMGGSAPREGRSGEAAVDYSPFAPHHHGQRGLGRAAAAPSDEGGEDDEAGVYATGRNPKPFAAMLTPQGGGDAVAGDQQQLSPWRLTDFYRRPLLANVHSGDANAGSDGLMVSQPAGDDSDGSSSDNNVADGRGCGRAANKGAHANGTDARRAASSPRDDRRPRPQGDHHAVSSDDDDGPRRPHREKREKARRGHSGARDGRDKERRRHLRDVAVGSSSAGEDYEQRAARLRYNARDRRERLHQLQAQLEQMRDRGELTEDMAATLRLMKKETRRAEKLLAVTEEARALSLPRRKEKKAEQSRSRSRSKSRSRSADRHQSHRSHARHHGDGTLSLTPHSREIAAVGERPARATSPPSSREKRRHRRQYSE